jgi:hypothetical protein
MASDRNRTDKVTLNATLRVPNSFEGAQIKYMSIFATDEHLGMHHRCVALHAAGTPGNWKVE